MSGAALADANALSRARRQTWDLIGIALFLYALLRFYFRPLPQDPAYHVFADTRVCGPIPRAGDVHTGALLGRILVWLVRRRRYGPATAVL